MLETRKLGLKLQHLTLGDILCLSSEKEENAWLFTTIIALSGNNLEALTLRLVFENNDHVEEGFDWGELDRIIAEHPKLRGLVTLTIVTLRIGGDSYTSAEGVLDIVRRCMPKTAGRRNFSIHCQTASM